MWLLMACFVLVQGANRLLEVPQVTDVPAQILAQFSDFNMVIHFDNESAPSLSFILTSSALCHQAIYLFNYDLTSRNISYRRPTGYKYLHLVTLHDPFRFENFSRVDYNFMPTDFVLAIVWTMDFLNFSQPGLQLVKFWDIHGMDRAASVLIFDLLSGQLFHCCFYCGRDSGVLKNVFRGGVLPNLRRYLNSYKNFNGHVFRLGYSNFPPFFWCSRKYGNSSCIPKGAEAELLKDFSKRYNFQYELIQYKSELSANKGERQAMVEAVHFRKVDWAVGGIAVSMERGNATDFTRFIKPQGYSILYASQDQTWTIVEHVLLAFRGPVWFCVGFCVVSVVSVASASSVLLGEDRNSWRPYLHFQSAVRPMVDQAVPFRCLQILSPVPIRVLFTFWWLMLLCMTTMYKSQLASVQIEPKFQEPGSVEQLLEQGFVFQANNRDWSVLKENLMVSSDPVYSQVLRRIHDDLDFCRSVLRTLEAKVAVIEQEIPVQYNVFKKCKSLMTHSQFSRLRLLPQNLFPNSYHAWCMQLSNPFRKEFSRTIGKMFDAGILSYWYKTASSYKLPRSNQRQTRNQHVSLQVTNILPALFIMGVGHVVSLMVFAQEKLFRKGDK